MEIEYKTQKWSYGIFSGEIIISGELPPDYKLVGWTSSPVKCFILFHVKVNILVWRPEVKIAFELR